ncbi:MAG TPA: hypothetical protein VFV99_06710 [Kofleriaceae bacterium]|nr:hypothetical protein [Kofleriaceae bacterium]
MRWLTIALVATACGGRGADHTAPSYEPEPVVPIRVEWKVEQGAGNEVNVALVVDGTSLAVGSLDAATEHEAGTPSTCALRAASQRRTEIVCGDTNGFAADLVGNELLVTYVANEQPSEVKRVPVNGNVLNVKMLVLPGSKL